MNRVQLMSILAANRCKRATIYLSFSQHSGDLFIPSLIPKIRFLS